jgi:uncharacterized membrane protein
VCLALLATLELWDAWLRSVPPLIWILWLTPLLILLPGLLRGGLRPLAWLSFVTLLYFVTSVLRVFAEPQSLRALLELLAVIGLFTSAMFCLRVRGRALRLAREGQAGGEAVDSATPNEG